MRAAQHSAPSAADAKLLSALRVCSDAGALGTVLHVREGPPPATIGNNSPAMASYGSEQSRGLPQQQEPLQLQGRPYSWEAGQGQGQAKRPRLAAREDDGGRAESARAGGYDGSEAWARSAAPASIGRSLARNIGVLSKSLGANSISMIFRWGSLFLCCFTCIVSPRSPVQARVSQALSPADNSCQHSAICTWQSDGLDFRRSTHLRASVVKLKDC